MPQLEENEKKMGEYGRMNKKVNLRTPERLREMREDVFHYTKTYVAEKLCLTLAAYSYIENGKNALGPDHAQTLARLYGCSEEYLLGLSDDVVKGTRKPQTPEKRLRPRQFLDSLGAKQNSLITVNEERCSEIIINRKDYIVSADRFDELMEIVMQTALVSIEIACEKMDRKDLRSDVKE